jgi:multiple sugar transport system permease protein
MTLATTSPSRAGRRSESLAAAVFLAPNFIGFAIFTLIPVAASLLLSFYQWDLFTRPRFIALANYHELLHDKDFHQALGNTLFLMLAIPISVSLSLLLALGLNRAIRGTALLRTAYFLPSILMGVPIFVLWQWMYTDDGGLFNRILAGVHLAPISWLSSSSFAKPSLMLMGLWASVGGPNMILYLAALQSIDPSLYEAARIDGASRTQSFFAITLPMVSPTTLFILVMSLIAGFQGGFDAVYIMTQGGPNYSTATMDYYIYQHAYEFSHLGYAATASWFLFMLVLATSVLFWTFARKRVHYA